MSKEINLKLEWERRDEETLRGYLAGHPETTLFLLSAANPQGDVKLRGAFVPDAEEQEIWDIENAKTAAGKYMLDWIGMVATDKTRMDWLLSNSHIKVGEIYLTSRESLDAAIASNNHSTSPKAV